MKYFIIVLCFWTIGLNAQVRFNKIYDYGRDEWQQNIIINNVGNYVTAGWSFINFDTNSTLINTYDINGIGLDTNDINFKDSITLLGWTGCIKQDNLSHNYYLCGALQWYDSLVAGGAWSQMFLAKLDINCNLMFLKVWGDTNEFFRVTNLEFMGTDALVIGASVQFENGNAAFKDFYVLKTDTAGNLIWKKRYNTSINDYMLKLAVDHTKPVIYLSGGQLLSPADNFSKPLFKAIDSSGNILRTKKWADSVYSYGALVFDRKLSDSLRPDQLLVVCGIDTTVKVDSITNAYFYNSARIAGVDTNFNIIWQKNLCDRLEIADWYNAKALKNGRVIVVGGKQDTASLQWHGWATLLDDYGHEIWDRTYDKRIDALQYLSDVQECPDGGFIFTGVVFNTAAFPTSDAWLVKVDSMGCEVPNCTPMSVEEPVGVKKGYSIYPNPSNEQLFILSEGDVFGSGMTLALYDIMGQKMYQSPIDAGKRKFEIQLPHYLNGHYLLKLFRQGREVYRDRITLIH